MATPSALMWTCLVLIFGLGVESQSTSPKLTFPDHIVVPVNKIGLLNVTFANLVRGVSYDVELRGTGRVTFLDTNKPVMVHLPDALKLRTGQIDWTQKVYTLTVNTPTTTYPLLIEDNRWNSRQYASNTQATDTADEAIPERSCINWVLTNPQKQKFTGSHCSFRYPIESGLFVSPVKPGMLEDGDTVPVQLDDEDDTSYDLVTRTVTIEGQPKALNIAQEQNIVNVTYTGKFTPLIALWKFSKTTGFMYGQVKLLWLSYNDAQVAWTAYKDKGDNVVHIYSTVEAEDDGLLSIQWPNSQKMPAEAPAVSLNGELTEKVLWLPDRKMLQLAGLTFASTGKGHELSVSGMDLKYVQMHLGRWGRTANALRPAKYTDLVTHKFLTNVEYPVENAMSELVITPIVPMGNCDLKVKVIAPHADMMDSKKISARAHLFENELDSTEQERDLNLTVARTGDHFVVMNLVLKEPVEKIALYIPFQFPQKVEERYVPDLEILVEVAQLTHDGQVAEPWFTRIPVAKNRNKDNTYRLEHDMNYRDREYHWINHWYKQGIEIKRHRDVFGEPLWCRRPQDGQEEQCILEYGTPVPINTDEKVVYCTEHIKHACTCNYLIDATCVLE